MDGNKPLYILDASVILKWFFVNDEQDLENALLLQHAFSPDKKIKLAIPDYALAEIANSLAKKLPHETIPAIFQNILNFHMEEFRMTLEIIAYGIEIMKKFPGVSFYDAGYHAIALLEGGIFITADERYFSKTHKQGNIMLLKDYGKKK